MGKNRQVSLQVVNQRFSVYMQLGGRFLVNVQNIVRNLASLSRKVSVVLSTGLLQAVPGMVLLAPPVSEAIIRGRVGHEG